MNKREARKEACFRAWSLIETALEGGWPSEQYDDEQEYEQVCTALLGLAEELRKRSAR